MSYELFLNDIANFNYVRLVPRTGIPKGETAKLNCRIKIDSDEEPLPFDYIKSDLETACEKFHETIWLPVVKGSSGFAQTSFGSVSNEGMIEIYSQGNFECYMPEYFSNFVLYEDEHKSFETAIFDELKGRFDNDEFSVHCTLTSPHHEIPDNAILFSCVLYPYRGFTSQISIIDKDGNTIAMPEMLRNTALAKLKNVIVVTKNSIVKEENNMLWVGTDEYSMDPVDAKYNIVHNNILTLLNTDEPSIFELGKWFVEEYNVPLTSREMKAKCAYAIQISEGFKNGCIIEIPNRQNIPTSKYDDEY